jgi:hypothetical protein
MRGLEPEDTFDGDARYTHADLTFLLKSYRNAHPRAIKKRRRVKMEWKWFGDDKSVYTEEQLGNAVDALAVGRGSFHKRLADAAFVLHNARLSGSAKEGQILALLQGLDDSEADGIAREIVSLYREVAIQNAKRGSQ